MTQLIKKENFTKNEEQLIINTVARGATPDELKLFLYTAKMTGLNPLTRQIHFVKRRVWNATNKAMDEVGITQTGIDGYRAIAERTGQLAGIDDAVYDTENEENPNRASVTVYRNINGEKAAFTASARWNEYVQEYEKDEWINGKKTGKKIKTRGNMWKKMPYLMLGKCAEALALRKAFPNDLSGIYTDDEMTQADTHVEEEKPKTLPKTKKDIMKMSLEKIENETSIDTLSEIQCKIAETDIYTDKQKEELYRATERKIEELTKKELKEVNKQNEKEVVDVEGIV